MGISAKCMEEEKRKDLVSRSRNSLSLQLSYFLYFFSQSSSYFSYVCVCVRSFFYATLVPLECELLHAMRYLIMAISIALFFHLSLAILIFFCSLLAVARSDKFYFGYSFRLEVLYPIFILFLLYFFLVRFGDRIPSSFVSSSILDMISFCVSECVVFRHSNNT